MSMFSIGKIKRILLTCLCLLILVSCSPPDYTFDLKDTKYIVSLSYAMEPKSDLVFFDKDNRMIKNIPYKGQGIYRLLAKDDTIYLYSDRLNEHYMLKSGEPFEQFKIVWENHDDPRNAVWDVEEGKNSHIIALNGGSWQNGYASAIIYQKNGQQVAIPVFDQTVYGLTEHNDKVYVTTLHQSKETCQLVVIDMVANKIIKEMSFSKPYYSRSGNFMKIGNRLIVRGDDYGFYKKEFEENHAGIASVSLEDWSYTSFDFAPEELMVLAYQFKDIVYVITSERVVYEFSPELQLLSKRKFTNSKALNFLKSDDSSYIKKVVDDGSTLHLIKRNTDSTKNELLAWHALFDKEAQDISQVEEIVYKGNRESYDQFDILILDANH